MSQHIKPNQSLPINALINLLIYILVRIITLTGKASSQPCPNIVPPLYGALIRSCGTNVQDTCYITCPREYDIIGSCFRVCQPSGRWSGSDVTCINRNVICPPLLSPINGYIQTPCWNNAGGRCTFCCNPGFLLTGSPITTCQNTGGWSSPAPTCMPPVTIPPVTIPPVIYCPAVIAPLNGYLQSNCANLINGQSCGFSCNGGFVLNGAPSITCRGGAWDGAVPRCDQANCSPSPARAPSSGVWLNLCTASNCDPSSCIGTPGNRCTLVCGAGFRSGSAVTTMVCDASTFQWTPAYNSFSCVAG